MKRKIVSGFATGLLFLFFLFVPPASAAVLQDSETESGETGEVSFARDIRPILQAHCMGCHQPAKAGGDYLMTEFTKLIAGGESGEPAVVAGEPDNSYLVQLITPHEGAAEMPLEAPPLTDKQIAKIRNWISQGAQNDRPPARVYDSQHPPTYVRPPVLTSVAVHPTQPWLAVSGIHEVIVFDWEQQSIVARLIGRSPRIEAVSFSPDGTHLAASGGRPGEFGELQIWKLADQQLLHSIAISGDVLLGNGWSPDGKLVAFGATDNAVRAVDAQSGQQVLFQKAAEDWVRDAVFSQDGSHLISVGRDRACKLTEVATERFVDNITSITPGVLQGGISSVARHPQRDEVLIGSADGIPKLYRIFRQTKRVIGDDANLLKRFPAQIGRIHDVAISQDATRLAAASGVDGRSQVIVYDYSFDTVVPDDIKAIHAKRVMDRNAEEKEKLEQHLQSHIKELARYEMSNQAIYSIAFLPDGRLVAAGSTGQIQLLGPDQQQEVLTVFPLEEAIADQQQSPLAPLPVKVADWQKHHSIVESHLPTIESLQVFPQSIHLQSPRDYTQLIVQANFSDGTQADVTAQCDLQLAEPLAELSSDHLLQTPHQSGKTVLKVRLGEHQVEVPVQTQLESQPVDFRQDVNPLLGKLGCNAGTCHGSQAGKNGFKLSLRGYDPLYDLRALTDELGSRRVNVADPDNSLILLKATAGVPHMGGQLMTVGSKYYQIMKQWIADGARLEPSAKVVSLKLEPELPVLIDAAQLQQFRVVATYGDGRSRDVTREAFIETGNQEIATVDPLGRVSAKRRGEAPILARYEGAFAATTLTIMGQRSGFQWNQPQVNNPIDQLVAEKWERMKIIPSELCDDYEFLRRIYLDLTGLPPTPQAIEEFVADARPTREKRDELIDRLVGSPEFVDHWSRKWSDLLQVNDKFLGREGAEKFHAWIRQQIQDNVPYDEFVRQIIVASGSNAEHPAASYYKILRTPEEVMENTTHLFLATRFNCNKCHDHPFERWTQDQYYATAAFFSQIDRNRDPASGNRNIGGTAVEGAKPLFEIIQDRAEGEMIHQRTQEVAAPEFPFDTQFETTSESRREQFAQWLTRPDNPYFATSYTNRIWGYLLGTGLIEPIDDIRASNPPSNPELLDYLTQEFVGNDFDTRHLVSLICKSRTYQLSSKTNDWNQDDLTNYSHAVPRRLPAEVLFDALHSVTGQPPQLPGYPAGTRAAQVPDAGAKLPSGLLATLGKPVRESACECERSNDMHLGSVLALVSGPDLAGALSANGNALESLVSNISDNQQLVSQLFLRVLNRPAKKEELAIALETFQQIEQDHQRLLQQLENRHHEVDADYQALEQKRLAALKQVETELTQQIQEKDPQLLEREEKQRQQIAALNSQLQAFDKDPAAQLLSWRQSHLSDLQWHPLLPSQVEQSSGASVSVLPDRSIRSQNKGKTVTTVIASTDLARVSAIRLEALAADDLPGRGPGLADNGNFVVNELKMDVEFPDNPGVWKPLTVKQSFVDFTQQGFPIETLFDGNEQQQGWAIHPNTGQTHWATFQLDAAVAPQPGTRFRFRFVQNYTDGKHQLGRFRISLTPSTTPVGLSVSEERLAELVADPSSWNDEARGRLTELVRRGHPERLMLAKTLEVAQQPLPVPAEIVTLRQKVAELTQPTARDPQLIRLETDLQRSHQQLQQLRLTATQDLTWALINSPSFLFNH